MNASRLPSTASQLTLLSILLLLAPVFGRVVAQDATPQLSAELTEEWQAVRVVTPDGTTERTFTVEEWRQWATANLEKALDEPVRIGPQEIAPESFNVLASAAVSPDGHRLAVAVTAYAMLTTATVVTIVDLDDGSIQVVSEPAFGDVEEFHWSPDGRYLAYPLGTARALGEKLRIDDSESLRPSLLLEGKDLLEAARQQGLEVATDEARWLPGFRDLSWTGALGGPGGTGAERLTFTSNDLTVYTIGEGEVEGDPVHWSTPPQHLRIEGTVRSGLENE